MEANHHLIYSAVFFDYFQEEKQSSVHGCFQPELFDAELFDAFKNGQIFKSFNRNGNGRLLANVNRLKFKVIPTVEKFKVHSSYSPNGDQ